MHISSKCINHVDQNQLPMKTCIITGCLQQTSVEQLPVLAGIPPAELRRRAASLALARRAVDPDHPLYHTITTEETQPKLKSWRPFATSGKHLLSTALPMKTKAHWIDRMWSGEWQPVHHWAGCVNIVQRLGRAGPRGRAREWATLGVHPLSWLLSNNRLEEVCGTLTKGTFSSRLLLSNQDKGCTPSVPHSLPLPLPLPPGFCSTCQLSHRPSAAQDLTLASTTSLSQTQ